MPHTRLVELGPDAMFVNCGGQFVYANNATARLLGVPDPKDLIGRRVFDFIHPDFHDVVEERIATTTMTREPVPDMEQVYLRQDGTPIEVSVSAVAFEWQGCEAIEVCAHDISEQKHLLHETQAAKDRAEQASLSKSRLVSAVSHDLRQPLQSLALFASVIEADPNLSPQSRVALEHLQNSIGRMSELLGAILDMARIDVGVIPKHIQHVDLEPLLADLVKEMAPQAQAKGLDLRWVPTSMKVESDPALLTTILRNLIANAIRYTDQGKILVGARRRGDEAEIGIYDTGKGIEPTKLKLIFEEFYQVGNPSRDSRYGLGLGLSIVERLSRLLAHPVTAQSQPGKGSVFCVKVRLSR